MSNGILIQGHVDSELRQSEFEELTGIDRGHHSALKLVESFQISLDRTIRIPLGESPRRVRRVIDRPGTGAVAARRSTAVRATVVDAEPTALPSESDEHPAAIIENARATEAKTRRAAPPVRIGWAQTVRVVRVG